MHHLCNLIHVKSSEAAAFLEKRGYQQSLESQFVKGWKCYCQWEQMESLKADMGGNGTLVGSGSQAFPEEGKYPYELSAADYKRALRKKSDFLERAIAEQEREGFAEEQRLWRETVLRHRKVQSEKSWRAVTSPSDEERERLDEEDIILRRKVRELEKDKVFLHACVYWERNTPFGPVPFTPEKLSKEYQQINSSNYRMREYRYYRRMFRGLLKYDPCIYFTYTDEDEKERTDFGLVKSLTLDELRIGDLAMLCSYDVLKIQRG